MIPILGDISSTSAITSALESYNINVVVDVSGANAESLALLALLKTVGQEQLAAAKHAGVRVPKLGFVYCSGTWVHGSSLKPVNDLTPVGVLGSPTPPPKLVAWRIEMEQAVLQADDVLDVMVVRPGLIYGRSSAIWTSLFEPIYAAAQGGKESVDVAAEIDSGPALVHVDDVAEGFRCAVEKLPLLAGTGVYPVFDLVTSQEGLRDILEAAGREMGFEGVVKLVGCGEDAFAEAMSTSGNICSGRAKQLLGWEPKRGGMVQGMDILVRAWVAVREL